MADYHAKLRAIVDGEVATLTPDDAKAIHVDLWDLRGRVGILKQRVEKLDAENDELVAQVLKEERAAVVARLEVETLRELVRCGTEKTYTYAQWREKARKVLGDEGTGNP